jgi:DNA-binding PadR family transcriptional regulator
MTRQPLTTEHALLGFLHQRPMHGYEIYQQMTAPNGLGLIWRLKQSHLYALLDRLARDGYVAAASQTQEKGPPRQVLALTDRGREAYLAWARSPVAHARDMRLDFLAKLYFARLAGPAAVADLVAAQRDVCREWLAAAVRTERSVASDDYLRLVHEFRRRQVAAMLDWLDLCEEGNT